MKTRPKFLDTFQSRSPFCAIFCSSVGRGNSYRILPSVFLNTREKFSTFILFTRIINKKKEKEIIEWKKKNISRTNGKWYQSSISCRKLLAIMLSKSIAPLRLTACKLYTLNLESFTTVRISFHIDLSFSSYFLIVFWIILSSEFVVTILSQLFFLF